MNNFPQKLRHLAAFVLIFGVAALVILYFLGYYDLSFLDRYKIFAKDDNATETDSSDVFSSLAGLKPDSDETSAETSQETKGTQSSYSYADRTTNVKKTYSADELEDRTIAVPRVSLRLDEGYTPSATFTTGSVLAKMTFDYKLPQKFALSKRTAEKNTVVYPEDDSEPYVATKTGAEIRPAVEVYMGYILMDSGDEIFLIDSDGNALSRYAYDKYSPAYMRDKSGKPVFMRTDEDGKELYYTLSDDGKSFVPCDISADGDNIGLYFDYPASFGKSDSTAVYPEKYSVAEGETPNEKLTGLWAYAVKNAEGEKTGMLTEYRFKTAHSFTLNRGAVIENNSERGSMSFVNENGRKAFDNTRVYLNRYDRYVKDFLLPPMTNGIESVGFYYFDSGLTRVRLQTVDYYNYAVRGVVRVVEDRDILIHPDGSEYDLPAGYTMTGYSEGAVVLKRDSDGMYGVLSVEGEWIAQPIYKSAAPFIGGLATLGTDDGRYGMIDKSGNIVLPFTYDYVSQNSSGVVSAFRNENGWSVFKVMRKTKILG